MSFRDINGVNSYDYRNHLFDEVKKQSDFYKKDENLIFDFNFAGGGGILPIIIM